MKLDQLIALAVEDPSVEKQVFDRLLDSILFVHAPLKPTGARLSLVQFKTSQGVMATPVFTDEEKARFAGRGNVRIIPVQGRQLFTAMPGATVVINPNDEWCILYPEEIRSILEGRSLVAIPTSHRIERQLSLRAVDCLDSTLVDLVVGTLSGIEPAIDAWIAECADDVPDASFGLFIVVAMEEPHRERVARSLTLALEGYCRELDRPVDIIFLDPGEQHEAWLKTHRQGLVYRREWLPMLMSQSDASA